MKKFIICLLCVVLCIALVGCGNKAEKAKEVLTGVLSKTETFTVTNPYTDKTTEETLSSFSLPTASNANNVYIPEHYTFVDLDGDGAEELVIQDAYYTHYLVLRLNGKKVYGYIVGSRSMMDLKTDGSFTTSSGFTENTVSTMNFNGKKFKLQHKAYESASENKYLVEGKSSDQASVNQYFKEWNKNTTAVTWETIETPADKAPVVDAE